MVQEADQAHQEVVVALEVQQDQRVAHDQEAVHAKAAVSLEVPQDLVIVEVGQEVDRDHIKVDPGAPQNLIIVVVAQDPVDREKVDPGALQSHIKADPEAVQSHIIVAVVQNPVNQEKVQNPMLQIALVAQITPINQINLAHQKSQLKLEKENAELCRTQTLMEKRKHHKRGIN